MKLPTLLAALAASALLFTVSCAPGGERKDGAESPPDAAHSVGSDGCLGCHPQAAAEWKGSQHARSVRAASADDEERLASLIPCSDMDASHVLGERHHVRFLIERPDVAWGEGRWLALPCGWSVHDKALQIHHQDDWRSRPFESSCAPCHVTGQARDWSFAEQGVGCESCHGPGSAHVAAPTRANVFAFGGRGAAEEASVCAACHLQGGASMRTGRNFPDGYTPGADLFDDYAFDWSKLDKTDTTEAIDVHQKLLIRRVIVGGNSSLRCTSCHELHEMTHEKHRDLVREDYCLTCHQPETYALKEYRQSCPVCEF